MKDRPQDPAKRVAWQPQSKDTEDGASWSPRGGSDENGGGDRAPRRAVAESAGGVTFRHKLMKRPRSPQHPNGLLPPIHTLHSVAANSTTSSVAPEASPRVSSQMPARERQERQMRSFLHNFLADDSGRFQRVVDLYQHALDSGLTVTDATVQEVVNMVPTLRGLKLTGCTHITDASIWAIARQCAQLDTIHLAQCERVTELGLRLLAHKCQLVFVDLSDCPQITDSVLQTLAAGCWMLQTFIMKRCQRITDAGIVKIAQCCKDLRHLDVSECEHVGEYGDKALVEIGKCCPNLTVLDLFGCRHVHDAGVRAIAKGCPLLTTLKLTGCRGVSSVAIRALASQCLELHTLSLAGCVKTTNDDLSALAAKCANLHWLDISGSPTIDARGVRALAWSCTNLAYLNLSECQRVGDAALEELARGTATRLATLSLANCPRVTEAGVEALTSACTNLVTLDVTGCEQIGRRFLQKLIHKLEFVEWASAFFGFQPLPNAAELCRQRDRRLLELRSATKIQAAMRGCRARGGLWEAKLKYVEKRVLPKIQARVRGFLVRKRLAFEKQRVLADHAARVIGREWRNLQLRRLLARAKRLRRIQESEEEAALIFQKIFRGYQGRKRVRKMREELRRQRQLDARIQTMREIAAIKLQRAYRGHRGRYEAAMLSAAREAQRQQVETERRAVVLVQRVYRGHQGRQLRAQRVAELLLQQRQHDGAVKMQKVFRGHKGRRNALILRDEAKALERMNAVLTIQRYWRGIRQKHLSAVLLGLVKLRARESRAAQSIQAAYRMHASRGFLKTMRMTMIAQRKRLGAATDIQRVVRGHRGRAECEVQRELRKLESQARPLFAKQARLQALADDQRDKVDALTRKAQADEEEERALTAELDKTMKIKTKYHDSSRITGTPQRYLTQYLQVQLADQVRAKRIEVALNARTLETLATALSEAEKQLRVVKRALEPLTDGVIAKTKENRSKRLQETVRRQRRAAVNIQRVFRGFRVRCAVREGGNCWIQLWTTTEEKAAAAAAAPRAYYYNALTGVTRWSRPLAMDIFHDAFAEPMVVQTSDVGATMEQQSSSSRIDGAWYEAFDDALQATYYFHSGTKEYQWETPPPTILGNALFTEHESSRRRRAWLEEQQQQCAANADEDDGGDDGSGLEELLAQTIVRGARLGQWEKRVEPISEHFFFYHPRTGELRASLSPRSVHASIGDASMSARRTARSISGRRQRPLHWQYRYGYEYDATGSLVPSQQPRPVWTEHLDADSGMMYYHNALTNEYRWEKPADFAASYEQHVSRPNASREWFQSAVQLQQESSRSTGSARLLTSRSVKTRTLGKKWVECVDPDTRNTYYYNEITGESRWSLSPRSARDTADNDDQISLVLFEQVKRLREEPVAYASRDEHMAWLEAAMEEKNWKKVDALAQQIALREQSQQVVKTKSGRVGATDAGVEPVGAAAAAELAPASAFTVSAASGDASPPYETTSAWKPFVDDAGNTFFCNEETGETSWSDPSSSMALPSELVPGDAAASELEDEWQVAYDGDGNAYYYNSETGETSWTDPKT